MQAALCAQCHVEQRGGGRPEGSSALVGLWGVVFRATVRELRAEEQQEAAAAAVMRGEVMEDGTLHPALEEPEGQKKSKACAVQ